MKVYRITTAYMEVQIKAHSASDACDIFYKDFPDEIIEDVEEIG